MKKYSDHSNAEKVMLTQEQFEKAVKLEAVERGIKLPITLDNIIQQHGFTGYTIPGDSVFFYEIVIPGEYSHSGAQGTGLAFKTVEEARNAFKGAIAIHKDTYSPAKIVDGEISVREVALSLSKPRTFSYYALEAANQNNEEYEKLVEECVQDISGIRQANYNREVIARKWAQYIELAGGNVEIAKRFWSQTERTEFPADPEPEPLKDIVGREV